MRVESIAVRTAGQVIAYATGKGGQLHHSVTDGILSITAHGLVEAHVITDGEFRPAGDVAQGEISRWYWAPGEWMDCEVNGKPETAIGVTFG